MVTDVKTYSFMVLRADRPWSETNVSFSIKYELQKLSDKMKKRASHPPAPFDVLTTS